MAPRSEVHASAFERKPACDSCTDSPSRSCHEYTFVFEALHTSLSYPNTSAMLRDGVFIITQPTPLNSRFGMGTRDCLAAEDSFDFVRHNMHILVQHKVACIQPNELGFW